MLTTNLCFVTRKFCNFHWTPQELQNCKIVKLQIYIEMIQKEGQRLYVIEHIEHRLYSSLVIGR